MLHLFDNLISYSDYLRENPIDETLGIAIDQYRNLEEKTIKDPLFSVDSENNTPLPPEWDDLIRLHYLITTRKVTTILEFGVGKSTFVFDDALKKNEIRFGSFVKENLRRSNPFELHSVDNNPSWIDSVRNSSPTKLSDKAHLHHCTCEVSTFNDRICTFYNGIPNVCPDFIYLDGPDQFSPEGAVRGIDLKHPDRLPMAADILFIEHLLLPGTLLVVDGRTANARFLKCNLQRNWEYCYKSEYDQHFFEMKELPLGIYNQRQIEFCLGSGWITDVTS